MTIDEVFPHPANGPARRDPINPFDKGKAETEAKETATADDADAVRFNDLLDYLETETDPAQLAGTLADCKEFANPNVRANAENKVIARAAGLGFKLKGKEFVK